VNSFSLLPCSNPVVPAPFLASAARFVGEEFSYLASIQGKMGSYGRRELEWMFQSSNAKAKINNMPKQIRAAQIREAIAQKEMRPTMYRWPTCSRSWTF
jgi:hypothetical protein